MNIEDQPVTVTVSGVISVAPQGHDEYVLKVELEADLSDLQRNMTALLSRQLDRDDRCGDQIAIQNATLAPVDPSGRAVVHLHYERFVCVKAFGKKTPHRLVGGDGVVQIKLTPAIEDKKAVGLVPAVESIQADGSLGELLRSGPLGAMVREKVTKALLSALQKGTDRSLTLPPAVQGIATLDKAGFRDEGAGRLGLVLGGAVVIAPSQIQLIKSQLKDALSNR
ncbi:MAG TPA: hypothetical protein VL523_04975 [Terriglobia bacterium]|nr:hypothetical protein [Terriglobia bacterium]